MYSQKQRVSIETCLTGNFIFVMKIGKGNCVKQRCAKFKLRLNELCLLIP